MLTGTKIDGVKVSQAVRDRVKKAVVELKSQGVDPCLATILVGDDQASATYVKNKHKACSEVGITTKDHRLDSNVTQEELNCLIDELNSDDTVHGILLQLPLPDHLGEFEAVSKILPIKDVDGLTPHNAGLLAMKKAALIACTPSGIMEMFDHYDIELKGKDVLIINRSNLVGKPLYHLLLQRDATVITCHSRSDKLKEHCQNADVIITAVGDRTKFELKPDMVKKDAIIIDVAISKIDGKLAGDADYSSMIERASYVTPVPGGVGPMTVAMLLKNTITAASLIRGLGSQR